MIFKGENFITKLKKAATPKNFLISFLGLIFLFILILFVMLQRQVSIPKDQTYEILPGSSSREIAYDLAEREIIKNPRLFSLYVKLKNLDTNLQAGRFEFTRDKMTLKELIEFLTLNAQAKEIEFTIPEGITVEQIAVLLDTQGIVSKENLLETTTEFSIFHSSGNLPKAGGLQFSGLRETEGYLFPDTYRVFERITADEIIKKMLENFERKVSEDMLAEIERQGRSLEDVVIMASILEKEVRTKEDMRMVADILWRRLKTDWALQVDSSLNYILEDKNPSLTYDQLEIDSPYNTYKYKGLPPTPISNPGLKAIKAAIYPKNNNYWFFLSKPDGQTVFARIYEEHLMNKRRYLR